MPSRRTVGLLATVGALFALFATFLAGVHIGVYQFHAMDASGRAALLVHELGALRSGAAEKLIKTKEIDLDGAITLALRFQESGHPWLFYPFAESYDHSKYLGIAARYRKNNPSPTPLLEFGAERETQQEIKSYQTEVAKRMEELQKRYGN